MHLQHKNNPVNWYPWGQAAFQEAQRRDCPIFLSVGYSTCHWCHVMERESFENDDVAAILNENFVSVKVDKEERPDVDRLYMTYIQATQQGGGGWPMSVFLTPDTLSPFFGGTYFPPEDYQGRPGFVTVLKRIAEVWRDRKTDIRAAGEDTMSQLTEFVGGGVETQAPLQTQERDQAMESCAEALQRRFDARHGGFSAAPKFPRPCEIMLLITQYIRGVGSQASEDAKNTDSNIEGATKRTAVDPKRCLYMATFTLDRMASGGVRDHLGGGFHRYSVDELWHVPHFEIML